MNAPLGKIARKLLSKNISITKQILLNSSKFKIDGKVYTLKRLKYE